MPRLVILWEKLKHLEPKKSNNCWIGWKWVLNTLIYWKSGGAEIEPRLTNCLEELNYPLTAGNIKLQLIWLKIVAFKTPKIRDNKKSAFIAIFCNPQMTRNVKLPLIWLEIRAKAIKHTLNQDVPLYGIFTKNWTFLARNLNILWKIKLQLI